jgi:hypothetical protein
MLDDLLAELVLKSNGEFKDKETIFKEFAKAHFTGNYLTIAHLIERILGEGSFRKIADKFAFENSKNVLASDSSPGFKPK